MSTAFLQVFKLLKINQFDFKVKGRVRRNRACAIFSVTQSRGNPETTFTGFLQKRNTFLPTLNKIIQF